MFFKDNGEMYGIREYTGGYFDDKELVNLMNSNGELYRRKYSPVKIERLSEPKVIKISGSYYLDQYGQQKDKVIPAGSLLVNDEYVISEEEFNNKYEQLTDSDGNYIDGMYIKIELVKVIKNPFRKPVAKLNGNNYILRIGNENCYILFDDNCENRLTYGFDIATEEELNSKYVKYDEDQNKKQR